MSVKCPLYLCLISGMLIQLAAATAANGTNRPIRGEMCYGRREEVWNRLITHSFPLIAPISLFPMVEFLCCWDVVHVFFLFSHISGCIAQSHYVRWLDNVLIPGHDPVNNTALLWQRNYVCVANFMSALKWDAEWIGLDELIPLWVHLVLERWQLPLWWQTHTLCQADCEQKSQRSHHMETVHTQTN